MSRARVSFILQFLALVGLAVAGLAVPSVVTGTPQAHALPEFATQTGEPCATCHVSPGGGGPRTLRGMLWAAQGNADEVPALEGVLIAPEVTDPQVLFDTACAACHGFKGEGLFGGVLAGVGLEEGKIRNTVLRGKVRSGMPSFEGQFTDQQLDILVEYVEELSAGHIEPPERFPIPEGELRCVNEAEASLPPCGGN